MKRPFHKSSSDSDDHRKYSRNRSTSRSRDKQNFYNSNYDNNYRLTFAKVDSDIRNHFRFRLPKFISKQQEQDTVKMLKNKLTQRIGPVQHITRSQESKTLNLGFKYDIDAISFLHMLQTGHITIKTSQHKIQLQPTPTRALQTMIKSKQQQSNGANKKQKNPQQKHSSRSHLKHSSSHSSSSTSNNQLDHFSDSQSNSKDIKLQVFGVPAYAGIYKVFGALGRTQGRPFKFSKPRWKVIKGSNCQYLQMRVDSQKADILLDHCINLQVDGRPIIVFEQNQRPCKQLLNYQIQLQFPKPIHPSKILKSIQPHSRIVQIVANDQISQDGSCQNYIITLSDPSIANQLKKLGDLDCGIYVAQPKVGQLVYRPIHLLPRLNQL